MTLKFELKKKTDMILKYKLSHHILSAKIIIG